MRNKKDVFARWRKHGIKFKIFFWTSFIAACIAVPMIILAVVVMLITRGSFASAFTNKLFWGLYAAAELAIILIALFEYRTLGSRRVKKVNKDLENSHFMNEREIADDKGFTVTKLSRLHDVKDGMLISAQRIKDDLSVVLHTPIHALIIATTRTGKTSTYVSPTIEILSRTSTQPCMIVTDPKGELYKRHANTLKQSGYNVHTIDLSDTYHSTLWNPFNDVWKKTARISEPVTQDKNKYLWGGRLYNTYAEAEQSKKEYTVRLSDEIFVDLMDLIYTACPVEAAQDKSWQQGARDLIFGMVLRMWEDARDGYLPKEKFNLYNLWWNLTEYAKQNPETGRCDILNEYIVNCAPETSRAPGMANTVLVSEDRTLTSYLGSVNQYLHQFADGGITQLTSGNEIEFSEWDEAPNALFIKIPDAKEGRHGIVTLMLVQIYKALLEKAKVNEELGETSEERLKRNCYFLMDEFGSLPKIHRFEKIVPIAASRKIFLMPVVQDYKQLDATYGQDAAAIIKNNCNVRIFLGTNDDKTRNEISEACGKQKIKSVSYNENREMSVSTSAQSVPLIYPSELKDLNNPENGVFGNSVIIVAGTYPIKSHTTPYFKAMDIYGIEDGAAAPKKDFMIFKEVENRYDIIRLIYLNRSLSGEILSDEERVEVVTQRVTENRMFEMAVETLKNKIQKYLDELKLLVSEGDFVKLSMATSEGKVRILDELAEKAMADGNPMLAMKLEGMISFFKYTVPALEEQALSESTNENYNA